MTRPPLADWESVFGFSEDPTPGDPEILEQLATEYRNISEDARSAGSVVSRLNSNELGEGESMEKLRSKLGELPTQVGKLQSSYETAAEAILKYADRLRESQQQADRALDQGREAKQQLDAAILVAAAASAQVTSLDNAEAPPPDDEEGRSSARRALADARQASNEAAQSVESAEAELEAARLLAVDAQELRTSDASLAKRELEEAEDDAVEGKNFWEWLGDKLNLAFSIIGAVVGVIGMFLTAWVGIAFVAVSMLFGLASLGLSIAKGFDTGEWDVLGIVLGVVGLAAGGIALGAAIKNAGNLAKVGLGQWLKNLGKDWDRWVRNVYDAPPQIPLPDFVNGGVPPGGWPLPVGVISGGGPPRLSVLDAVLNGIGLITGVGGFIYSIIEYLGGAEGAKVKPA
ncbi:putative T7SS-secreted protein [Streptomyces cavernicola]|uniref:Putative T7SS secretion signal domain-containing protein n=1 Tax=Streptomyces cavernicola TaxID=3043613 RepID=A0ABT6SC34_9ACTN|nr:hypothetical protein [Streptomyces sp. B-S-A6]MDI3405751.1 hypothetical protein [Streptomyces sp. B-S-A6]